MQQRSLQPQRGAVEVEGATEAAAELVEAVKIEEAGPDPAEQVKEAEHVTGDPDTLTNLPERPVTSIGGSGRPRTIAPTVTSALGGTLRALAPVTIETLLQQKKQIETLTSSTKFQVLLILFTVKQKYKLQMILILKSSQSILFQLSRVMKYRKY